MRPRGTSRGPATPGHRDRGPGMDRHRHRARGADPRERADQALSPPVQCPPASDDKTYPYIKIHWQEDFPKVSIVRRMERDGARYYGPFTSAYAVRQTLDVLRRVFPYLDCNRRSRARTRSRASTITSSAARARASERWTKRAIARSWRAWPRSWKATATSARPTQSTDAVCGGEPPI